MKMIHVAATAAAVWFVSGTAFAATMANVGYEKWERNHEILLCTDYGAQFKDAMKVRGARNVSASVEKTANQGEALCRTGNYAKGDRELGKALVKLHLSPTAEQVDAAD